MLSISTALKRSSFRSNNRQFCHPERSVLCEVKDLLPRQLGFFTAAKYAAFQNDEAFVIRSEAKHLRSVKRDSSFAKNTLSE
jgi:hypothetical protein